MKQKKFRLVIELGKQKRIVKKLNKNMVKDNCYIRVDDYYTESNNNKKR